MSTIIDGKAVADKILDEIKTEIVILKEKYHKAPGLAVILVGDNPASQVYVRNKKEACAKLGINSYEYRLSAEANEEELISLIKKLNCDPLIHGILLQLPVPKKFSEYKLISLINPDKDVDGFHPENVGKLLLGLAAFKSCTPYGICELLKAYQIPTESKHVVIIGRSNIVGKPLAFLLMQKEFNATVTVCHSKTANLKEITKTADILVAAIGQPLFVKADFVKDGAVVVDVGMNRIQLEDGQAKLVGDVDFNEVSLKTSFITPVPGGVGKMTIAMLMKNTLDAFKKSQN
ncbi:MAG: bifunctional methylenetetrahydrofolate dehydrogenase/methenyltetrahydrofolate cyclohydrolase FolD [Candidatus Margulisiibacteriota bacterium]|jgi:methylenetetrahydrofolate dehydrogenase (NADP+)/methenyltetrahydrofolate cyclohydrolase